VYAKSLANNRRAQQAVSDGAKNKGE